MKRLILASKYVVYKKDSKGKSVYGKYGAVKKFKV